MKPIIRKSSSADGLNLKRATFVFVASVVLAALPSAQLRVRPIDLEDGTVALGLILRQLNNTAVFMQATAHPVVPRLALRVTTSTPPFLDSHRSLPARLRRL